MDEFHGRAYVFIPCFLEDSKLSQIDFQQSLYVTECENRFKEEIATNNTNQFKRGLIERLQFDFHGESEHDVNCETLSGEVYFTLNERTNLCIVTVIFCCNGEPITQLLDRITREDICFASATSRHQDFHQYLLHSYGLRIAGKSRVCLSTGRNISDAVKPSIFANEMFDSDIMHSAKLLPNFGMAQWKENIGVYNTSEIYASKTSVLRHDATLDGSDESGCCFNVKAIERDTMLTFIVELLMFREASIKRANLHVLESIQDDERLDLSDINELVVDFKSAILFWDLDIFLYPSAQQLADSLFSKFDIDRALDTYRKNQAFLEQRVQISNAIQAEKETKTINYIAILVFFFEVVPALYVLAESLVNDRSIKIESIIAMAIASSSSLILFLAIVSVVRWRNRRSKVMKKI